MPAVTFKAQLDERRMVVADRPDDGWRDFTLEVLDRWRDEPDVDKAWEEIQKTASSSGRELPPRLPFIDWVIGEAKIYKRVTCEIIPKSENLENRAIAAAERDWRSRRQPGNADLALTAAAKDKMASHGHGRPLYSPQMAGG
jgi:hypothetical protein